MILTTVMLYLHSDSELEFLFESQYIFCDVGTKDFVPFTLISDVCSCPNFKINTSL
jgi:hypothetical protein